MVRAEPTRSTVHQPIRRPRALVVGLSFVVLTVAVLQTAIVPVLGVIAAQLNSSIGGVSWAVTANLLAAAAATPLIGRLADLHSKKRVLLIVLVVVLAGSLLAATTSSLPQLIVGRILQAASFSLAIFLGGAVTGALAMILIALSRVPPSANMSIEARCGSRAMNHEWG